MEGEEEIDIYDDSDEFGKICFSYYGELLNRALFFTKNHAEAEDLVSDTLAKAVAHRDNFEKGRNFRAWLHVTLRNSFIDNCRRNSINVINRNDNGHSVYEQALNTIPDNNCGAAAHLRRLIFETREEIFYSFPTLHEIDGLVEQILREFFSMEIWNVYTHTRTEFRVTMALCDIFGFSYAEIARLTQVTVDTVKSRLHRSRKLFRNDDGLKGLARTEYAIDASEPASQ